ncbi:O-antigen ligase family protein [Clostridium isatidis]|uniref:O-antigen ligase family protein n=1 Tax=Clostridium isatidis TaxID=182773 RepID=UPI003AAF574D
MELIVILNKESYKNLIMILSLIFIYGYGIKALINKSQFTIIVFSVLVILSIYYCFKYKVIPKIVVTDYLILIFIIYIIFINLFKPNYEYSVEIIVSSLAPYFIGRLILLNSNNYIILKRTINIISWVIIIKLFITYFQNIDAYRISIGNSTPIAIGELIGIFTIVNLFSVKDIKIDKVSIFNTIIGILVCFIILNSRGTVFSIIISSFIVFFVKSSRKIKIIAYMTIILSLYSILFSSNSRIIEEIPKLKRFNISIIANDSSIIGNSEYMGRKALYSESIEIFKDEPLGGGMGRIYSHNIFLEVISSTGIIGIITFIMIVLNISYDIYILYCKQIGNRNYMLLVLLLYTFIYRQSSFAMNAHKSLFIFLGMFVTYYYSMNNSKIKLSQGEMRV